MRRHLQLALLLLAMTLPLGMAWLYFVAFARHPAMSALYLCSKVLQAAIPILGWYGLGMARSQAWPGGGRGLAAGALTGAALALPLLLFYRLVIADSTLLAGAPQQIEARLQAFGAATPVGFLLIALILSLAHSLFEEYYWRWFLFGELRRRLGRWPALALANLAFAAHHFVILDQFLPHASFWLVIVPFGLAVGFGGVVWAWLFDRYQSLAPAWLSHALADGAIMTVGYWLLWGTS